MALLGLLRVSIALSTVGKASSTATALAQSQMEYLRGLSYDALGTSGGIPAGAVPQSVTATVAGTSFETQTYIQYVDDPADGIGALDQTGIITDYKLAKVTVLYTVQGVSKSLALVSTFAPPSLESSTGGGTLQIKVVDAGGAGVAGASVHIVNQTTSPTIDLTTTANAAGLVYLPGAATSSAYEIYVSKNNYSTAQTYLAAGQNANPTPGLLTVVKDQTTTGTFAIDVLSALTLSTFSPPALTAFADTFASGANITASTSVIVGGGALTLNPGDASGSAVATAFSPQYLAQWGALDATLATSTDTSAVVQVYDGVGALIPDAVLAGNSTGYTTFPIDLSGISTSTYSSLSVGALLATATTTAPSVLDWSLSALAGPTPLPSVAFTLTGTKAIGSTSGGSPLYKTTISTSTGALAQSALTLEWDGYTLDIPGYDIVDACPVAPYTIAPGVSLAASLTLTAPSANALLVSVTDSLGAALSGVSVDLSRTGYSANAESSSCGNAYFGGLAANTYTVTITKVGYTTTQFTNVSVSGMSVFNASFP